MEIKGQIANAYDVNNELKVEGFSDENAKKLSKILRRFLTSYSKKDEKTSDKEWLKQEFNRELPELDDEEIEELSRECIAEIKSFDKNLKSLNETIDNGGTKEGWFAKKVQEATVGVSINEYGNYLKNIDNSIQDANTQMMRVVTNMNSNISQNMNLDGFMAEQYHVNSFNMNSKLTGSNYVAEVLVPEAGQTYGKNSFDVVIRDNNRRIAHQYQMKYGATAQDTIGLIRDGNYNNQRIVVPSEQLEEVKKAFPGKSIVSSIGGTDKVTATSQVLGKAQAKEMQKKVQAESRIQKEDWNYFKTKDLALNIGKNAGMIGIQAAAITTGFDLARKAIAGEKIDADETIELALKSGTDAGIKAAATGAIKVGIEKGVISIIPKGTSVGVIANVVCVGIENVKILAKVASGELTMIQGLDHMGRVTTSMVYGLAWGATGSILGAAALSWIPIVGPIIGAFIGGMVGYLAGSKFGEVIYTTAKKVVKVAREVVGKIWGSAKKICRKATEWLFG